MTARRARLAAATAALVTVSVLAAGSASAAPVVRATTTSPCGQSDQPPQTFTHVVVVVMENRSYDQIIGNPDAPQINQLAQECGLATNYQHVGTGDGDKILMTSGSTWGITTGGLRKPTLQVPNVFSEVGNWAVLAEAMPRPCFRGNSGGYVYRHNPALAYADLAAQCRARDRRLRTVNVSARYTMILPAMAHSMHQPGEAPVGPGDTWLGSLIDQLVATNAYQSGTTVIFVVWDEGGAPGDDQLPMLVISPYTQPGTQSATLMNHVALLRTTQDLLGLAPFDTTEDVTSFGADFGLVPAPPTP